VLTRGTGEVVGGADVDALAAYLDTHRPVAPPATDRISLG